jgi:hypothetical protein
MMGPRRYENMRTLPFINPGHATSALASPMAHYV